MYALIQLPVIITAEPVSGHPLMQKHQGVIFSQKNFILGIDN